MNQALRKAHLSIYWREMFLTFSPVQGFLTEKNINFNFFLLLLCFRLRLADNKVRARTGDIPLKMNKKLPWLVKGETKIVHV